MRISAFSTLYNVPLSTDDCGDTVVRGAHGDICEYGDGKFLASFWGMKKSQLRTKRIKLTFDRGFGGRGVSAVNDTDEFMFRFDGSNKKAASWFIKALQCKKKVELPPERLAVLRETIKAAREKRSKKSV